MIRSSPLDLVRRSMISMISDAKRMLIDKGILGPYCVHLSNLANEALLKELEGKDGKRHSAVFEIFEMQIKVDPDCPPQGAYIVGREER